MLKRLLLVVVLSIVFLLLFLPVSRLYTFAMTIVCTLGCMALFIKKSYPDKAYLRWAVAFYLFCGLSILWSISVKLSLFVIGIRIIPLMSVTFFISMYVQRYQDLKIVLLAYYLAATFFLFYVLFNVDLGSLNESRIVYAIEDEELASELNANYVAGCFVIAIYFGYFLFWRLMRKNLLWRLAWVLLSLTMIYMLLISGSRTSLGLFLIPIFVFTINRRNFVTSIILVFVVVFLLFFIITRVPVFSEIIGQRIIDAINVLSGQSKGTEDVSRLRLIEYGLQWSSKKPLFGYGINCYRVLSNQSFWYSYKNFYAHNNYVELLVDVGMIGLLIYYSFSQIYFFKRYRTLKNRKIGKVVLSLLFVILFSDFFWVAYYNHLSQILLCITFTLIRLEKNNLNEIPI